MKHLPTYRQFLNEQQMELDLGYNPPHPKKFIAAISNEDVLEAFANYDMQQYIDQQYDESGDAYATWLLYPGYGIEYMGMESEENDEFMDEEIQYLYADKEDAVSAIDDAKLFLEKLKFPLTVYRTVRAKPQDVETLEDWDEYDPDRDFNLDDLNIEEPGLYWSIEQSSALEFGTRIGANYLLTGIIGADNVEYMDAILAFVCFSHGIGYNHTPELEITAKESKDVKVVKVDRVKWNKVVEKHNQA